MSEKIKQQSLSLPKGGGAISGIGESFSPNEFSGTASMSLPLPISPCRDAEPDISLQYSSSDGNGPFGLGFSLSVPYISRATNKGTPKYDGSDYFVIKGGDYLVPLNDQVRTEILSGQTYLVQQYAPRHQSEFFLIEYWQVENNPQSVASFWKVTSRDHVTSIFGKTNSAQVANVDNPDQVFSWLLQEVYDSKGNHQLYFYQKENCNGIVNQTYENQHVIGAQRYLTKVCYGNDVPISDSILLNAQNPETIVWHFELVFNYGEYQLPSQESNGFDITQSDWVVRPDPFSTYEAGFEIRTLRRCQSVMMLHRFEEEWGKEAVLTQATQYRYQDLSVSNGFLSQLIGITQTGYSYLSETQTYDSQSYPELVCGYTEFQPTEHSFEPLQAEKGQLNGLDQDDYSLIDLYGQGIPGILYADGQSVLYREPIFKDDTQSSPPLSFSQSADLACKYIGMRYGKWQQQESFPIANRVYSDNISLSEQTGNGQLDLMINQAGSHFYWQANPNQTWTPARTFQQFPLTYNAPNQVQLNATGAGLSDLLQIRDDIISVFPSARAEGFDSAITQERESSLPSTLESSETTLIQFADMAGSGVPQLVKIESGQVTYWPNLSYGRFTQPVVMDNAPLFNTDGPALNFSTARLFLADIDGSGTTDLIYVTREKLYLYMNQSGNAFADAVTVDLLYPYDNLDQISFADVYGQGTTCLILSYPHGLPDQADLSPRYFCYDFCQRQKPYLINQIQNNLGATTTVEYASSVDFYLADKKAGLPWVTNLPFPVQVIAKTTVTDALSQSSYSSLFAYHHGYYDGEEREFKGFGRVDRQDTEFSYPFITQYNQTSIEDTPKISKTFDLSRTPNLIAVDQPGWQVANADNVELLSGLQQGSHGKAEIFAYRLNTTAINTLCQTLYMQGINGLLSPRSQTTGELYFGAQTIDSIPVVFSDENQIGFNGGAMSQYYWELFFYIPFLIAKSLQTQQQNQAAKQWYEYVFNPTIRDESSVANDSDKYWRFIGLRSENNPVLKEELNETWAEEVVQDTQNAVQLYAYHNDPFSPHAIAQLRPVAYQKTMVIHYVDNLIGWADKLYRQYTVESIVEASMLYITAYDLLGNNPINLGVCELPKVTSYENLNTDEFLIQESEKSLVSVFLEHLELALAPSNIQLKATNAPYNMIDGLYFGLPENEQFLRYWDTVRERLYNIRHGLNIEGVRQYLALFQPAIDPAQLIAQLANGGSVSGALAALQVNVPYYRFSVMIQLAKNTAQTVIQFGQSLLSALEKKDAEQLALMYNQNQLSLLQQTTGSRQAQVDALAETLESLKASQKSANERYKYYEQLLENGLSGEEEAQLGLLMAASAAYTVANGITPVEKAADLVPNIFGFAAGGQKYSAAFSATKSISQAIGEISTQTAGITGLYASYARREQEWELQKILAESDKEQIEHQIKSTEYQKQAAEAEVTLLEKNITQEQSVQQFLKNKFTNEQLYQWMVGKLSAVYFQAYQLSYEMALQAQQAWHFEKGADQSVVKGGYWDGLHQGLLAGEGLMMNLMQMENAYMQQNKRRFEITKTISLLAVNPEALLKLRDEGLCIFDFSSDLFNDDYPNHTCRQIASLSLTLPTLIGPYQNIHATLTQLRNSVTLKDGTKRIDWQTNQQIALSQGVNDSGMFTLNFADERYLPFEGTGVVSTWQLNIPKRSNPSLDFDNLTDVIIQLNYTAVV